MKYVLHCIDEEIYQEVAGSYSNMALNNMGLKKYEQAIEQLQKAIDIHREYYGERHPKRSQCMSI